MEHNSNSSQAMPVTPLRRSNRRSQSPSCLGSNIDEVTGEEASMTSDDSVSVSERDSNDSDDEPLSTLARSKPSSRRSVLEKHTSMKKQSTYAEEKRKLKEEITLMKGNMKKLEKQNKAQDAKIKKLESTIESLRQTVRTEKDKNNQKKDQVTLMLTQKQLTEAKHSHQMKKLEYEWQTKCSETETKLEAALSDCNLHKVKVDLMKGRLQDAKDYEKELRSKSEKFDKLAANEERICKT